MEDIRVLTLHELLFNSGFVYQSCQQTEEVARNKISDMKKIHPAFQYFILKDYAGEVEGQSTKYLYKILSRDLDTYSAVEDRVSILNGGICK
jgi:hypothetical protein